MLTKRSFKSFCTLVSLFLATTTAPLQAASDTFIDYQNYNHGYCPECNCFPCQCKKNGPGPDPEAVPDGPPGPAAAPNGPAPCKPAVVCATDCGISLCWIGIGIAVVATAAALIISSNNGHVGGPRP